MGDVSAPLRARCAEAVIGGGAEQLSSVACSARPRLDPPAWVGEPRPHRSRPLPTLLDALDAKPLGNDRFEARSIEYFRPRVFGGELLAQVLATAARTVQDRACHAIHVDFLFHGDPKIPIEYGVRRVREGRRFVQRQVSGYQRGREIVLATMSFTTDSTDAVALQHKGMPEVPGPDRKSVA